MRPRKYAQSSPASSDRKLEGYKKPESEYDSPLAPNEVVEQRQATSLNNEVPAKIERGPSEPAPDRHTQSREADQADRESEAEHRNEMIRLARSANDRMNSGRLERLQAIADQADAARGELEEYMPETETSAVDDAEAAAAAADQESEAARAALEAEAAAADAGATAVPIESEPEAEPKKYVLKINGQDVELTEAEVLARAQKVASADEYLQTAADALKRTQAPPLSDEDVPASVQKEDMRALLTAALQGEEEAIAKIAQRLEAPSGVTPDVQRAVDDRVSFRSAVDWFKAEYADVTSDPELYNQIVKRDSDLAKSQPALPYRERLKIAGDATRTWLRNKIAAATPATPVNPKLARKAAVAPVPQASARAAAVQEDDVDEPTSAVIERLARARMPHKIRGDGLI